MIVCKSRIIENREISTNIYKLIVELSIDCEKIKAGQFFMLKTLDNSFLLPRPISVNDVGKNTVTFLYRIEGSGTERISNLNKDDEIQVTGPLGNGFDLDLLEGRVAIIGGGIGIAPLLYLAKSLNKKPDIYLGYKDKVYISDEFEKYANKVIVVTEEGKTALNGFVTDHIDYSDYDVIVTCGPEIMMGKIAKACKEKKIKCFVSLERRMACGLGACLGCTVETTKGIKRACKDGPVFPSEEIIV